MKKRICLISLLLIAKGAWASNSLSTLNSFAPGSSQLNFTAIESSKTLDHRKFSILGFVDTSYRSLAIYNSTTTGSDVLSFTHVGMSYGLSPKLEIGVKGPVIFSQAGDSSQPSVILTAKGFVNIDGFAKYRLIDGLKSSLSLMFQAGIANGDEVFYVGPDSGLNYSVSALIERSFGRWLLAANIGFIQRTPGNNEAGTLIYFEPIQSTMIGSVGLGRPITKNTRVSGEVLLASHDFVKDQSDRESLSAEALLSFHTKFKTLNLSYGLGAGLTNGVSTPSARGFLGFQYPFGPGGSLAKKSERVEEEMVVQEEKDLPAPLSAPFTDDDESLTEITEQNMEDVFDVVDDAEDNPSVEPARQIAKESAPLPVAPPMTVVVTELPKQKDEPSVPENIFQEDDQISVRDPQSVASKFILNNIDFEFDSAQIDKASLKILNDVLEQIKNISFRSIKVWGHTDFYGPSVYNEYLGLRRSKAVYDFFKKAGIPDQVLDYDALGERRPLNTGLSDKDRRKNRRVEIIVIRN